jgi:hypothetical protein
MRKFFFGSLWFGLPDEIKCDREGQFSGQIRRSIFNPKAKPSQGEFFSCFIIVVRALSTISHLTFDVIANREKRFSFRFRFAESCSSIFTECFVKCIFQNSKEFSILKLSIRCVGLNLTLIMNKDNICYFFQGIILLSINTNML